MNHWFGGAIAVWLSCAALLGYALSHTMAEDEPEEVLDCQVPNAHCQDWLKMGDTRTIECVMDDGTYFLHVVGDET